MSIKNIRLKVCLQSLTYTRTNRVFSHDVTAAIFVPQNNETVAILVFQTNPVGIDFSSHANAFFCSNKFA